MIYGLLPIYLVRVLHVSVEVVGLIEGMANAATSVAKIASGAGSDWLGRRKPIVFIGYVFSALNKLMFPLGGVAMILAARIIDRVGKGIRDAPRDALLTDVTSPEFRGAGFGLRLAFYTIGFVVGPITATMIMSLSHDDFQLVFWLAIIPAMAAAVIAIVALHEIPQQVDTTARMKVLRRDIRHIPASFWWLVAIASMLSLARFSHAFLALAAHESSVSAALTPIVLVVMHLAYACGAYPFGVLSDRLDRRLQLLFGVAVLILAAVCLAAGRSYAMVLSGAALWGLQLAVTQGLLSASIADAAPPNLRGTAFGVYELAIGSAAFLSSIGAGILWGIGGPSLAYSGSAGIAVLAALLLCFVSTSRCFARPV
jgi:MFS family permease